MPVMDAKRNSMDTKNEMTIFHAKSQVLANTALIHQSRSLIEEIRLMIISNYAAAFVGNRQLANTNTDEIYANKIEVLSNITASDGLQKNYLDAQVNKTKLDYLRHRSDLNTTALKINEKMAAINTQLIAINDDIMETNEEIIAFNEKQIGVNEAMLEMSVTLETATSEKNEMTIVENKIATEKLLVSCTENEDMIKELLEISDANLEIVKKNKAEINERMQSIIKVRKDIFESES